jgi:hypothetical protein
MAGYEHGIVGPSAYQNFSIILMCVRTNLVKEPFFFNFTTYSHIYLLMTRFLSFSLGLLFSPTPQGQSRQVKIDIQWEVVENNHEAKENLVPYFLPMPGELTKTNDSFITTPDVKIVSDKKFLGEANHLATAFANPK